MKCPTCNGDLKPGFLAIHGTGWGLLFNLWGVQQCYFQGSNPNGDQEEMIVPWSKSRPAFRCAGCKTVVIPGVSKQDLVMEK
jgi:hypothetical protein